MSELLEKILDNRNIVYADGIYWENMRRIFVWEVCEGEIDSPGLLKNIMTRGREMYKVKKNEEIKNKELFVRAN